MNQTHIEYILEATTLQEAKMRFQERLLVTDDPQALREVIWPLLYGNEGAAARVVLFNEPPSQYG